MLNDECIKKILTIFWLNFEGYYYVRPHSDARKKHVIFMKICVFFLSRGRGLTVVANKYLALELDQSICSYYLNLK